ncbi:MAG TPA: PQQ-binding-like beta-propeller repeat protein [Candidatus Polarisedimenticolia bacterium]|nr:PQQ-binding-like beta-propeller repeat protein [Candidatus Polarisedimenticolia bacterium]
MRAEKSVVASVWARVALVLIMAVAGGSERSAFAATGDITWLNRIDLGWEKTYAGPITADRGKIFAAGAGPFRFSPSSDAMIHVVGYDNRTGQILWHNVCLGTHWDDHAKDITARGGMVFVAGIGNLNTAYPGKAILVCAFDADTGVRVWEDRRDGEGSTQAIVAHAGRVFVSGGWPTRPVLRAYDAETGVVAWEAEAGGSISPYSDVGGSIAIHGNLVFAMGRDAAGGLHLRAYDAQTGAPSWETEPLGDTESARSLHVAASAGVVFAVVTDAAGPRMSGFDADTGAPLWQTDTGGPVAALAAEGGRVFASGVGSGLRAYAAASGEILWDSPGGGMKIAAGGGTVSVVGGSVQSFDAANGERLMQAGISGSIENGGGIAWSSGRVFTSGTTWSPVYYTHTEWIVAGYDAK